MAVFDYEQETVFYLGAKSSPVLSQWAQIKIKSSIPSPTQEDMNQRRRGDEGKISQMS